MDISINTQYRFIEIELNAMLNLMKAISSQWVDPEHRLFQMFPNSQTIYLKEIKELFKIRRFQKPTKRELLYYAAYQGLPVVVLARISRLSIMTAQKYKRDQPELFPVFRHWDKYPDFLAEWAQIRPHFNLFNDELSHTKRPIHPNQTKE